MRTDSNLYRIFNFDNIRNGLGNISHNPFDHCVIDGFFNEEIAHKLAKEFIDYNSDKWFYYKNPIEDKKALNDWNIFPELTYEIFTKLYSPEIISLLSNSFNVPIYPDIGLHGGGWHIHGSGGNLNPHLDYSIHPKLGLQRKINIIIYLSEELEPKQHGGHLGLWSSQNDQPHELKKEVEPIFNRAVIFDTTQNSWHGMSKPLIQPEGIYRKSIAVYYLTDPSEDASNHKRALFALRENQKDDPIAKKVLSLRSDVKNSHKVYKTN